MAWGVKGFVVDLKSKKCNFHLKSRKHVWNMFSELKLILYCLYQNKCVLISYTSSWTGFGTKYLTCSNAEWFCRRSWEVGQRPVSVCHHTYCAIHILTDLWSRDRGRIFGFHPKEVMRAAPPTQRLFTPDRPAEFSWLHWCGGCRETEM